jgi:hypothetical protein
VPLTKHLLRVVYAYYTIPLSEAVMTGVHFSSLDNIRVCDLQQWLRYGRVGIEQCAQSQEEVDHARARFRSTADVVGSARGVFAESREVVG